ncbi:nicotinate-nucleotide diphosphorylase (carboxylating), partial [Acinetobacter baumannii]
LLIHDAVKAALLEDLGRAGDITSQATIPADIDATALFVARKPGVLAGLTFAREAMRLIDPTIRFEAFMKDGDRLTPGARIAEVSGPARGVL